MKLVNGWPVILRRAWSVRLMAVAAVFSAISAFFAMVDADMIGMGPVQFAILAAIANALGLVARVAQQVAISSIVKQFMRDQCGAMGRRTLGVSLAVLVAGSTAFVAPWEGLRTEAYRDVVGIWTVCYGETKGVKPGDRYSASECEEMLERELADYAEGLGKCLKTPLPDGVATAFVSWSYNI